MNLAILSPSENAYPETFIQAHKNLPFKIVFYFGRGVPTLISGDGKLRRQLYKVYFKLKSFLYRKLKRPEYTLQYLLKSRNINCVLAEYGVTAANSLTVVKSLNLPLIVHFHGYDSSNKEILSLYREKYLEVFKYAKSIVSVSKKMTADLTALGCPEHKIVLNPYGPNVDFFNVKPSFNLKHFVAVGRFVDKKGTHLTIKAFSKITKYYSDAKLFLVGEGKNLDFCKNLVKELAIEEQVTFLGIQSPLQIMKIFSTSLALVQHSVTAENGDSEGTPVAVLEASAAGLPVISTRHAGIPDVIENGKTGFLVEEFDIDSMANFMRELCENPEKAKLMGQEGSQNIRLNFSMERHLNTLAQIINKAVVD